MRNIYVTESRKSNRKYQSFTVHFFQSQIRTVVTSIPSVIRRWIQSIRCFFRRQLRPEPIGLGVQWHPRRERDDPADTLQLCVGNSCLIIQLSHARSVPRALRTFLGDSNYKFVGIRNSTDAAEKLDRSVHNLSASTLINLADYSTRKTSSTETMAFDFLGLSGVRKDPEIGMSRWSAKLLNKEQVQYACVDAHVSFLIAKELKI